MNIEISIGEALDKVSILTIKLNKIQDIDKLRNVAREVNGIIKELPKGILEDPLYEQLCSVNLRLWEIEDEIRECERIGDFNLNFIRLARAVYHRNDERADVKREINIKYKSNIIEEKSYKAY